MKFVASTGAAVLLASLAAAAPLQPRQALTDADILQFALTLEHLENVFYKQGLTNIPYDAFIAEGFSPQYYQNLQYVAMDEEQHVELLTAGLTAAGATPVAACEYSFPFYDAKSFVALASVLEGVGTAAYLGAAPAIQDPEYLAIAGSILITEAIHTSLQRFNLYQVAPANPYGSSLGANEVFTLAAAFITSCPSTNPVLPFAAFPTLTATGGLPTYPGAYFTFSTTATDLPAAFFVTFVSGLQTISVPATYSYGVIAATLPTTISGQSYAILTSVNTTAVMDSEVLAGPAILEVTPPPAVYSWEIL